MSIKDLLTHVGSGCINIYLYHLPTYEFYLGWTYLPAETCVSLRDSVCMCRMFTRVGLNLQLDVATVAIAQSNAPQSAQEEKAQAVVLFQGPTSNKRMLEITHQSRMPVNMPIHTMALSGTSLVSLQCKSRPRQSLVLEEWPLGRPLALTSFSRSSAQP